MNLRVFYLTRRGLSDGYKSDAPIQTYNEKPGKQEILLRFPGFSFGGICLA